MEMKRNRGRQPVPKSEKKVPIVVWVKFKYKIKAIKDCREIELKYKKLDQYN